MLKTKTPITRLPAVPTTTAALMKRRTPDVQNFEAEVVPLLRLFAEYKDGFTEALQQLPGTIYAVANFNLRGLEPEWCREKLNLFDMKVARSLLGRKWSKRPMSERPTWVAVPEQATFLHYNMIWDVPIQHQETFFLEAPSLWRSIVPSGQMHIDVIGESPGEARAVRAYSGKTFHPRWTIDNTITSSELRRKK